MNIRKFLPRAFCALVSLDRASDDGTNFFSCGSCALGVFFLNIKLENLQ